MPLTINLPEQESLALAAKAKAQGLSAEDYARQALEHDLAPEWLRASWDSAGQNGTTSLSTAEIDAEIADAKRARRNGHPQPGA